MREFNHALLGKWCWRLLVERRSFWYKVLVARYGEEVGRLEVERPEWFFLVAGDIKN